MIAARVAMELIIEVRYALRMVGVPVNGPAQILGDNMSVMISTTIPPSVLKKKHLACGCHLRREAIAADILRFDIYQVESAEDVTDILTYAYCEAYLLPVGEEDVIPSPGQLQGASERKLFSRSTPLTRNLPLIKYHNNASFLLSCCPIILSTTLLASAV